MPDSADRLTCEQVQSLLVDGGMRGQWSAAMTAHLASCVDCRAELATWQAIAASVPAALPAPPPPPVDLAWGRLVALLPTAPPLQTVRRPVSGQGLAALLAAQWRVIGGEVMLWGGVALLAGVAAWFVADQQPLAISLTTIPVAVLLVLRLWGLEHLAVAPEIAATTPVPAAIPLGLRAVIGFGSQLIIQGSMALAVVLVGHMAPTAVVSLWLAPALCIMSVVLCVTLALGPTVAAILAAALWLLRILAHLPWRTLAALRTPERLWQNPWWMLAIAGVALVVTVEMQRHHARGATR